MKPATVNDQASLVQGFAFSKCKHKHTEFTFHAEQQNLFRKQNPSNVHRAI